MVKPTSRRGVLVGTGPPFAQRRVQLATLTARHALPAMFADRQYVEAGGLVSYGSSVTDMYRHARIEASMTRAKAVVTDLYEAFVAEPSLLPADWAEAARATEPGMVARDYIAGMTDRFALAEYARVFQNEIQL